VRLGQCQVCCSSLRLICARDRHQHESMRVIILQVRILQIQWVFIGYLRRRKNTQPENYVFQYCWNIARNCQNTLGISKAGIPWSCAVQVIQHGLHVIPLLPGTQNPSFLHWELPFPDYLTSLKFGWFVNHQNMCHMWPAYYCLFVLVLLHLTN